MRGWIGVREVNEKLQRHASAPCGVLLSETHHGERAQPGYPRSG
jgi:hypothetical protein